VRHDNASEVEQMNPLLTEEQTARALGNLSVKTLQRWRWAGRGPRFIKIGAAVRYDPEDLAVFIEAGRRNSTSDPGKTARRVA
jgi:Helix-turn-helix domain